MTLGVAVDGGTLAVHELGRGPAGSPVVMALHGITANALAFGAVAQALNGDVRLLAPDLRGRADSRSVRGPWGLAAHAADVIAVLDAARVEHAILLGHSMGAYVAALTAYLHPSRVSSLVLVDGGVAIPAPSGDIDAVLEQIIGPAMTRLAMTFADDEAYLDFWRKHPAVGPGLSAPYGDLLAAYLRHDLVGREGERRSSCVVDAIRADGVDVMADPLVLRSLREGTVPATLLYAARGMLDEPQGLFDADRIAAAELPPTVRILPAGGVNHYTVLFEPQAVRLIAYAVGTST